MVASPFVIAAAPRIAGSVCRVARQPALEIPPHQAEAVAGLHDHVIIVGYGLNGRNLARVLKAAGISYVILEQNGQMIRRARLEREPIFMAAIDELERAGADQVVPEEFETSIEIFARVLRLYGVPSNTVEREIDAVRSAHYGVFRGAALPNLKLDALQHLGIHAALDTVEVEPGAAVRDGVALYQPDPAFWFRVGDTVVLVGTGEALERATRLFRAPAAQ